MPTLKDEHLPEAYPVWLSAGWNDKYQLSESDFVDSWKASPIKIGYWLDDQLVAIGRANTDGVMYSMIHDVVVDTEFRGRGYGKSIINELTEVLKGMSVRSIQLMSAPGQSSFYRSLGFKERPQDGPGMEYDWASSRS